MSIYGYSNRQVNDYGLQELSEISLQMPVDDLRQVAHFLIRCADEAEAGTWRTSHRHLTSFNLEGVIAIPGWTSLCCIRRLIRLAGWLA